MRLIGVALVLLVATTAGAVPLADGGKSAYVIVIAEKPLPANRRAAEEFRKFFKQMTGAELPIQTDAQPLPAHAILIGPSRHVDAVGVKLDAEKLGNDGFVLKTLGDAVVVAGPGPRGSMYGTYELLERLGVRWFTPTVTRVPKKPSVDLPALDGTQIPAFEYREPYYTEAWDKDWAARNKLIGHSLRLDESTGGNIRYGDFVHSFDRLVPPALHEKHPEYFPLIKGKRENGYVQRCLSNADVLKLAIENVRAVFKNDPSAVITTVSQNDTDKWCECDACKALVAKYGGVQSGVYLWFVNQVAEAIEKEYPDKLIDTLAYQFTEAAPKHIAPRKNVRVRLCPIANCQAHPYEADDFPASKAFVKNLADWHAISGDTLYIWHYTTNFAHYLMPLPDYDEFAADAKLYRRSGVRGVFFQGAYCGPGGADAELKSWIMSRVLWDPDHVDVDALATEWMKGVYGKAWRPMHDWWALLREEARDPKFHPVCFGHEIKRLYPDQTLARGRAWFDEAEKLAAGDETATRYVAKSRLWFRYASIVHHDPREDLGKFVADCKALGITHTSEQQGIDAWAKDRGPK
jgi:hypothetical protein